MSPKAFLGFSIVTIVVIIAAAFSIVSRYEVDTNGSSQARLLPGLTDRVNDVTEIVYQDNEQMLTVRRDGESWGIVERANYTVDPEVVRTLLVSLSEMRQGEPKTRVKDRYARIQVQDVDAADAQSMLLTVRADESVVGEIIVGRESREVAGAAGIGRYVRKPGEDRAWLASGRLDVPSSVKAWVKPEFMHVASERIATARIVHPDGHVMSIKRAAPKSSKFLITDLPKDATIKYQSDIDNIADGLDHLELEDVARPGEREFPADKTIKTEYRTSDGLIINAESYETEKVTFWGKFSARAADDIEDAETAEKIKKEAEAINAKVSDWVYQLPSYKYRYMTRRVDEVLEKPEDKKS